MLFKFLRGSALDEHRGNQFFRPRYEPTTAREAFDLVFSVRRGVENILLGCSSISANGDGEVVRRKWFFDGTQLDILLSRKEALAPDMDDFAFIRYVADGMTGTYADGSGIFDRSEYSVTAPIRLLLDRGIVPDDDAIDGLSGNVLLSLMTIDASTHRLGLAPK